MSPMVATATATWDTAVELTGVTKYFDLTKPAGLFRREKERLTALDDVSFSVARGEFVAYAGPNGAGKSTTFKLLCGMLAPQGGTVRALGRDPVAGRIPVMRETGVLFGNRSELWWDHPVRASFEWKRSVWDIPAATYARMFRMVTDLLGLDEFMGRFARELSLGQRMRANLGLMLLHAPTLLLLDEPTLGMDVLAKRQMIAFLKHINREEGATILVTSHDMDDLTDMARRLLLINRGKIAFDGDYDRLMRLTGDKRLLRFTAEGVDAARVEAALPGATLVSVEDDIQFCFEYDAGGAAAGALLRGLADIPGIADLETGRAPIEAVIAELYERWAEPGK